MAVCPKMQEPVLLSDASPGPLYAVTLADTKKHLRVDFTDDDEYIETLIASAHEKLNGWNGDLGKVLITQTWRTDFDTFPPSRRFDMPMGPIQSATIQYYDSDNTLQTLAASKYATFEDRRGEYLWLDEAEDSWPGTYDREDAVQVTVTAGYGTAPADVPNPIRMAIYHIVADWYEFRLPTAERDVGEFPRRAEMLLSNYRRHAF